MGGASYYTSHVYLRDRSRDRSIINNFIISRSRARACGVRRILQSDLEFVKKIMSVENLPVFTEEEVASHNTKESLWLIIDGKVYDVTEFQGDVSCNASSSSLAGSYQVPLFPSLSILEDLMCF